MSQRTIKLARKLFDKTDGEYMNKDTNLVNGVLQNNYNRTFRKIKEQIKEGTITRSMVCKELKAL